MVAITFLTSLTDAEFDSDTFTDDSPNAINNSGVIVGSSTTDAIQWVNGTVSTLWTNGNAYGINDLGEIVGSQGDNTGLHAVALINGTLTTLTSPGQGLNAEAFAVNKSGMVIGEALSSSALDSNGMYVGYTNEGALIWTNGQLINLGTNVSLNALNDSGQAVGSISTGANTTQGFSWTAAGEVQLGTLASGDSSVALAVNNSGVIVGGDFTAGNSSLQTAVIWQNDKISALPTLAGDGYTYAAAINDAGIIVGVAKIQATGSSAHAVMWIDGQITDLNSLLPANSGWLLKDAYGIDNNNEIFGYGVINGIETTFVLTLGTGAAQIGASAETVTTGTPTSTIPILDSGSDIVHYLSALQTLSTEGHLGTITLTDSGTPDLTVAAASFTADTTVLNDITTPHAVTVRMAGTAAQHNFSGENWAGANALQFADQTVIVAATPGPANAVTTGNVTELYSAVLAREPDVGGLAFYQNFLKTNPNTSLQTFAEFFLNSTEYTSAHTYAQTTAGETQFIDDSYQNLLHRTPSASEVNYYLTNVLQQPGTQLQNHAQMLVYFSASAEFLGDVQITAANPASASHWLLLT